jgi:hypothetical protein
MQFPFGELSRTERGMAGFSHREREHGRKLPTHAGGNVLEWIHWLCSAKRFGDDIDIPSL